MNSILKRVFIVFLSFLVCYNVKALGYTEMQLIPVDTVATVDSESFTYNDFSYSSAVNEKGNTTITFGSIYNKTQEKMFVSIDVLLFDENEKNIGLLTYCTDKDKSSDYSGIKFDAGQSGPFNITVTSRYFVKDKYPKDVKFIAVMDDNKYCHIGGYDNYAGLTIEQISNGQLSEAKTQAEIIFDFYNFLQKNGILLIGGLILGIIISFGIYGAIINALYRRMFGRTTTLAYLPITNNYVTVKLAFGPVIAKIFLIAYFVSIPLSFIGIGMILLGVISIVSILSFIMVLIKLLTKQYALFYFEPKAKRTKNYNEPSNYQVSSTDTVGFGVNNDLSLKNRKVDDSNKILDLSYGTVPSDNSSNLNISQGTQNSGISSGSGGGQFLNNTNSNDEEESDLTKFFN